MFTIDGKYTNATVFTDNVDNETISQIMNLCNQEFAYNTKIRIMPDTHAGKGCVIGFTANLGEMVIPNLVGLDIGCGMECVELGDIKIDLAELDLFIHEYIPAGRNFYNSPTYDFPVKELYCYNHLKNKEIFNKSLGTLGGGNHFIEIDISDTGNKYLVIHTGSRNLGKQVAEYYQDLAFKTLNAGKNNRANIIYSLKAQHREQEIESALKSFPKPSTCPKELSYLLDDNRTMYLHDMQICQDYATMNRYFIAKYITDYLGLNIDFLSTNGEGFETVHNYINFEDNIIRKGAVSAYAGQKLIIPINMRDGSLICKGLGNPDWNYSAPHGAGRLMSRSQAKGNLNLEEFEYEIQNVYTTSVNANTLDESPMAYKSMSEIISNIQDTVEIVDIIKPIYNFKAGE